LFIEEEKETRLGSRAIQSGVEGQAVRGARNKPLDRKGSVQGETSKPVEGRGKRVRESKGRFKGRIIRRWRVEEGVGG
jgi:hypothetical protein